MQSLENVNGHVNPLILFLLEGVHLENQSASKSRKRNSRKRRVYYYQQSEATLRLYQPLPQSSEIQEPTFSSGG